MNEVRESLARINTLLISDLKGTSDELRTLIAAIRKETDAKSEVLRTADSGDQAYIADHMPGCSEAHSGQEA